MLVKEEERTYTKIPEKGIDAMSPEEIEEFSKKVEAELMRDVSEDQQKRAVEATKSRELLDKMISKLGTENSINIEIAGMDIEFVRVMTRKHRRDLLEISDMGKTLNAETFKEAEERFYSFLASVCKVEELQSPEAWEELDEKTGGIVDIFTLVSDRLTEELNSVEKFRGRVGTPPVGNDKDVRRTSESP